MTTAVSSVEGSVASAAGLSPTHKQTVARAIASARCGTPLPPVTAPAEREHKWVIRSCCYCGTATAGLLACEPHRELLALDPSYMSIVTPLGKDTR